MLKNITEVNTQLCNDIVSIVSDTYENTYITDTNYLYLYVNINAFSRLDDINIIRIDTMLKSIKELLLEYEAENKLADTITDFTADILRDYENTITSLKR